MQSFRRGALKTFSASSAAFVTPNNVPAFELQGSATRRVCITRLIISATTTGSVRWERYSTTVTNGTPAALTEGGYEGGAATAVARNFTGATTAGALVSRLGSIELAAIGSANIVFGDGDASPIILNGISDFFVVSYSAAITNGQVTVEWYEE